MPVAIRCRYRAGGAEDRFAIRDLHVEYMMAHRDAVAFGGPTLDGLETTGVFLLLVTDDVGSARDFMQQEPYCRAGLFGSVDYAVVQAFIPEPHTGFLAELHASSQSVAQELRARTPRPAWLGAFWG